MPGGTTKWTAVTRTHGRAGSRSALPFFRDEPDRRAFRVRGCIHRHGGAVLTVQRVALPGLIAHFAVLALVAGTVGPGPAAWIVSVGYALAAVGLLARAVARSGLPGLGPADLVTLARSALVGGVAALVVEAFSGSVPVALLT